MPAITTENLKNSHDTSNMPAVEARSRQNWYKCRSLAMIMLLIITITLFLVRLYSTGNRHEGQFVRWRRYDFEKQYILKHEKAEQFGSSMELTSCEQKANDQLMDLKWLEYRKWDMNESSPLRDNDFNRIREKVESSVLFKILRKMPKGAVLHVHDVGMVKVDFLIQLTYYDNLWICITPSNRFSQFHFAQSLNNTNNTKSDCKWFLLKDYRLLKGPEHVDAKLREIFTIKTSKTNEMFERPQKRIKQLLYGLISYAPVWKEYCRKALDDFLADGVQYVEIRSEVPKLYDLNGSHYTQLDPIMVLKNVSEDLSSRNASFLGSKLIYAPSRNVVDEDFEKLLYNALVLKFVFQDYLAGLDLVGDDSYSRPLRDFTKILLQHEGRLNYYLTVSEAQSFDLNCDENLVDAYMLGSQRLVFSYPLLQHPYILRQFHKSNVALIVNPISHQLLKTPGYTYYHPAGILFAFNLNLVVSSDYPSLWQASPLSHDFYLAFMKIAPRNADLKLLKQLAYNSIMHSAMTEMEREQALNIWKILWDKWICELNSADW